MPLKNTLIFGPGWIGKQFQEQIPDSVLSRVDIADEIAVKNEIEAERPSVIINCAGKTGSPNIDSCEKEPGITYRSNVIGPIVLARLAQENGAYFVHLGSGCIYEGDNGGKGIGVLYDGFPGGVAPPFGNGGGLNSGLGLGGGGGGGIGGGNGASDSVAALNGSQPGAGGGGGWATGDTVNAGNGADGLVSYTIFLA